MWPFRTKEESPPAEKKFASFYLGTGPASWSARDYSVYADEGYARNPVVHACVSKLAKSVASIELKVYKQSGAKVVMLDSHPLLDLYFKPNPMQSGRKFIEQLASYYLIGGEAFILAVGPDSGPPKELHLLTPQAMKVQPGRGPIPEYYEYKPGQAAATRYRVDPMTGKSAILHLKTFNPLDPWRGLPPLAAAAYGVDIFNAGQRWNKALLDNEGRPSGAMQLKDADGKGGTLTDEQYQRLKSQIDEQYSGASNAGRPMLLEGGLEWVQMSLDAKDMDHRENMLTNARFIAGVYHTPPQLLNIPGESTFSNYGQAVLSFWGDTAIPLLTGFLDDLNGWLAPMFDERIYYWYDEEMIPGLEQRRAEKATRINAATYMTIDEKREAMGLDTLPDGTGATVLVPSTSIPLELVGVVPLNEPGSPADKPDEGNE